MVDTTRQSGDDNVFYFAYFGFYYLVILLFFCWFHSNHLSNWFGAVETVRPPLCCTWTIEIKCPVICIDIYKCGYNRVCHQRTKLYIIIHVVNSINWVLSLFAHGNIQSLLQSNASTDSTPRGLFNGSFFYVKIDET